MRFTRDPLSVEFDNAARELIGRAVRQYDRKRRNASVRGWVEALVPNPVVMEPREDTHVRLSRHERAFQRSLYYDPRIHQLGRKKPNGHYSLKCEWQPVPVLPGQPRRVRVTLFRDTAGARHVEAGPKRESFVENPDLRGHGRNAREWQSA